MPQREQLHVHRLVSVKAGRECFHGRVMFGLEGISLLTAAQSLTVSMGRGWAVS